jgi:iron complex outermembrane recepter protein
MRIETVFAALLLISAADVCTAADIQGLVRDAGGAPLSGVSVSTGAAKVRSDSTGGFTIPAAAADTTLLFEQPGYYSETLHYKDTGAPAALEVILTPRTMVRQSIKVVASRLDVTLAAIPAATSSVGLETIDELPRAIGIDEPLQGVPGVKVDNQANGERVHLSIRGQGILSEHGIRGIQVLYDGIPLNDPSGFSPDVYDIDWAGVQEVNVVRGPVAFLYGGGSSGGVIDVRTAGAAFTPFHGGLWSEGGSGSTYKTRGEISGSKPGIAYQLSGSRAAGDGYREHTEYWANNVYGRLSLRPTRSLRLSPYVLGTGFFNQNAEGLNLNWGYPSAAWWKMANPDSLTYNEYQLTHRVTGGFSGEWTITDKQRLSFSFYTRHTNYKEPVPSSVEHRELMAPGGSAQYHLAVTHGRVRHEISAGTDIDWQFTTEQRYPNLGNAREGSAFVANSEITQHRAGGFLTDQMSIGSKWTLIASMRYDDVVNSLRDKLKLDGLDLSGDRSFRRATGRLGASWRAAEAFSLYADWGQGFLPPATEELFANPAALGGFNKSLVPASSAGEEMGIRGGLGHTLSWDVAIFRLATKNDFERYRVASRPLETFYANAGESRRYGVETSVRWLPTRRFSVSGAYTYSNFTYTNYSSLTYTGLLKGHDLPNSPRQQGSLTARLELWKGLVASGDTVLYARAFVDPTNATWSPGYALFGARVSKGWQYRGVYGTLFLTGRNLAAKRYYAFTEPDPDGNSYQPGAGREAFVGLQVRF